ncbi:rod shape-determining protein [Faecalicatena contorta]|uniref:rod shape-determining protein n=1 Tax=Faecalicatena contorta TaxID=39482 RepID=UPI001F334C8D|nr:rod shape-determining protein [Faecalicatena contorta]MCF2554897.1 rod shape-determining protein [Faecalicatena contorta]MCF2680358.1 rod shape-determining protein [Faecalicatena contorta]
MARNTYGLDLGSYEIKVYDKKKDTLWKEKSVIAIENNREILAVGDDAFEMYEKTPSSIEVIFPMQNGVISRFTNMQFLLQNLLKKDRQLARGAEYVIAVPTDITEVQKKAFFDLVIHSTAKAREVNVVERSIADAVGLNIDVKNTKGVFIANFGGDTTELSVLAGGGMVLNRLLKIGGSTFDQAIITLIRNSHDFLIGSHSAELLRQRFDVFGADAETAVMAAGRDLITGVPMRKGISVNLVRAAFKDPLMECIRAIRSLLDRTPPEVRKAIYENGIFLTGGIANTKGLDLYIEKSIGIPVRTAQNPEFCSVNGIKKIIMSKDLRQLAFSMLDEKYRWMR